MDRLKAWWLRQWPQISTRAGIILTTASTLGPQLAQQLGDVSPALAHDCTLVGTIAGALLIVWNQGGASHG